MFQTAGPWGESIGRRAPDSETAIPHCPAPLAEVLRALPLPALRWPLERMARSLARRHPSLFTRLGEHGSATFLIEPTDLPVAFRLWPRPGQPTIEPLRRPLRHPLRTTGWHARISGPLAALLGMIHGTLDGDALFFSRDLSIEGDTEAILALRNAIDDAELDLPAEAAAAFGPLAPLLDPPARLLLPLAERVTGVALSRAGRAVP